MLVRCDRVAVVARGAHAARLVFRVGLDSGIQICFGQLVILPSSKHMACGEHIRVREAYLQDRTWSPRELS